MSILTNSFRLRLGFLSNRVRILMSLEQLCTVAAPLPATVEEEISTTKRSADDDDPDLIAKVKTEMFFI